MSNDNTVPAAMVDQADLMLGKRTLADVQPGGRVRLGDVLVTSEMVDAACRAYFDTAEDSVAVDHTCMEAALKAALAARQPVGEPVFRERPTHNAYRGSFSGPCRCWADADHAVGNEVMRYAAPPAQVVDLGRFRKLASWVANCAGHGINDAQRRMGEELLALIDSQGAR